MSTISCNEFSSQLESWMEEIASHPLRRMCDPVHLYAKPHFPDMEAIQFDCP